MHATSNRSRWLKFIQRRLLSFLSTPEGIFISVLGIVITVNTLLYVALGPCVFTAMLDILGINKWTSSSSRSLCDRVGWKDNIGGIDVSYRTSFGPIDVVYTWVNGSDIRWLRKKSYWKAIETNTKPPVGSSPDGSMKKMVRERRRLADHDDYSAFAYNSAYDHEYGNTYDHVSSYGSDYASGYGTGYGTSYGTSYGYGSRGHYGDDYHTYDHYDEVEHEQYFPSNETVANTTNITNATIINSTSLLEPEQVVPIEEEEKDDGDADNRYRDSNELLYSLRSLEKYAPWVRHIYLVTDNQIPNWLNMDNPRLTVVPHSELFPNKTHLPVFSSPAIEAHLHRIPGLSQRFAYFNDDVFLGAPTWPEDFIGLDGAQKVYLSWDVPKCNDGCSDSWLGDGHCDKACNVSKCGFDFPDCVNKTEGSDMGTRRKNKNKKDNTGKKKEKPTTCAKSCPDNWLADKVCDNRCNVKECAYDGGDCGLDKVVAEFNGTCLNLADDFNGTGDGAVWASSIDQLPPLTFDAVNSTAHTLLSVPYGTQVGYVNYSNIFPTSSNNSWEVREATLDDPHSLIQNSVVVQRHSTLLLVFHHPDLTNPRSVPLLPATAVVTMLGVQDVDGVVTSKAVRFRVMVTEKVESPIWNNSDSSEGHRQSHFQVEGYAAHCTPLDQSSNVTSPATLELVLEERGEEVAVYIQTVRLEPPKDSQVLIRQWVGSSNIPSAMSSSTPHYFKHRHIRALGVGEADAGVSIHHESTDAFRVQIPSPFLPVNSTSTWMSVKVDAVVTDSKSAKSTTCKGTWEDNVCVLSRLACVEAMVRTVPQETHRRRLTRGMNKRPQPIRISPKEDSKKKGKTEAHLRGKASESRTLASTPKHVFDFHAPLRLEEDDWLRSRIDWWMQLIQSEKPDRRRLLDTFGDSLIFVNQLYNKRFGPETGMRKVPAHMPHFIDREVLAGLQDAYADEFDATSQHRFRSSQDMQYSFAYFYWLQNTKNNQDISWEALWYDELDVDHNGYLDENELLTLTSMAKGKEPSFEEVEEMRDCLTTAIETLKTQNKTDSKKKHLLTRAREDILKLFGRKSRHGFGDTEDLDSEYIYATLDAVLACPISRDGLRKNSRKAPTFEKITQLNEVAFEMIGDDFNKTREQLNSIRARKTKFVCVNDDMKQPTPEMVAFLQDFYLSFFPFPSQFELPPNVKNKVLYLDQWKRNKQNGRVLWFFIVCFVVSGSVYLFTQHVQVPSDETTSFSSRLSKSNNKVSNEANVQPNSSRKKQSKLQKNR